MCKKTAKKMCRDRDNQEETLREDEPMVEYLIEMVTFYSL